MKGGDIELTCSPEWERKTFLTSAFDSWGYLKRLNIPVLVLSGTINSTFSKQARDSLSKLGKSWILESFSGSSHFLPMESTQQVVDRIYKFVSK